MKRTRYGFSAVVIAALLIAAGQQAAYGNVVTTETFDTSALVGNPAGPFSVALVFIDGSGTGDGNNMITLSSFSFGGGSAGAVSSLVGGVIGDLTSSVSLSDTSFFNQFVSSFTPGTTLSFLLDLTTNLETPAPDEFSLVLLQGNSSPMPTADPNGLDSLLTVEISSSQPTITTFPLAIPEPATLLLLATALLCAFALRGTDLQAIQNLLGQ